MSKKKDKKKKKHVRLTPRTRFSAEHRSDCRTAQFIVRRLTDCQEDLADLIPDLRTFDHFAQIQQLGWAINCISHLRKKYDNFTSRASWDD